MKTEQGKVQGKTINDGKVKAFLGMPYAAPPVGDLRWKAPEPPAKWKGTRDATNFGAHCAQGRVFDDMIFQDSGPSEDCLFLNVYAPADATDKSKLPVMFWIHGGGYSGGAKFGAASQWRLSATQRAWCWSPSTIGWVFSVFWRRTILPKKATERQGTTA